MSDSTKPQLYGDDVARIHVDGYGFHWSRAADGVLQWLSQHGVNDGKVVDLGCGGGEWLANLTSAGYETCGVDISPAMIRIARGNAPKAELICGSLDEVTLPDCDAVTSLGEPISYLGTAAAVRRTMRHVYSALRPGGLFIFDVRDRATQPVAPIDHHRLGPDWFCYSRNEENHRTGVLIRNITTFRQSKNGFYRRTEEVHRLKTFAPQQVADWLRDIGFRVQTRRSYGDYKIGPHLSAFLCRKPTG